VWHAAVAHPEAGAHPEAASRFVSELGWREFAWYTLSFFPDLATKNWRADFDAFPWPPLNRAHLEAWQRGRTGFALVDAGMRELWHTGHMHNRVRMVTASFLVKNLLIDWREGERWFWDTLVDADAASNAFNWQWVAGSGADAAPYFRVFNPERQREKFDPHGEYVRRWAPEHLAAAAADQLFGEDLAVPDDAAPAAPPEPIVDLAETRRRALAAYDAVQRSR
jgi:deoxyribodipyrimidine photo-lyase